MNSYTDAETLLASSHHVFIIGTTCPSSGSLDTEKQTCITLRFFTSTYLTQRAEEKSFGSEFQTTSKYFASLSAKCLFIITLQSNRHAIFHFFISKIVNLYQKLLLKWYLNKI